MSNVVGFWTITLQDILTPPHTHLRWAVATPRFRALHGGSRFCWAILSLTLYKWKKYRIQYYLTWCNMSSFTVRKVRGPMVRLSSHTSHACFARFACFAPSSVASTLVSASCRSWRRSWCIGHGIDWDRLVDLPGVGDSRQMDGSGSRLNDPFPCGLANNMTCLPYCTRTSLNYVSFDYLLMTCLKVNPWPLGLGVEVGSWILSCLLRVQAKNKTQGGIGVPLFWGG